MTMVSKAKNNAIYLYSSFFKEEGRFFFSLLIIMLASTLIPVQGTVEKNWLRPKPLRSRRSRYKIWVRLASLIN